MELKHIVMLVLSLAVVGGLVATMFWFLRRLNLIEEELWGKKKKEAEAVAKAGEPENAEEEV